MFKKISKIIFAAFILVFLGGCQTTTTTTTEDLNVALPDLTGLSRTEIADSLENLDLIVNFRFDVSVIYESDDEYDKFVQYGSDRIAGDIVAKGTEISVYTTPLNLSINYLYRLDEFFDEDSNNLQLVESDYTGQEFIADGIGEVTVYRFVDGDTTWFQSGSESFSVRYLGIDTPESTALYQAWGKAASNYTIERLENAEKIVLQAEGERLDGNGRYLAWVWYIPSGEDQFVLLNLELVELAYSKNKVSTGSKYTEILTLADWDASLTKRRVWGELDPYYDYSKEGTQMSIEYLMNNFNDFVGLKVVVSGIITKMVGQSVYLQEESGYGICMYIGYTTSAQLQIGANVTVGGLVPTYYSGSPQVSNFSKTNLTVNEEIFNTDPVIIDYNDFSFIQIGSIVKLEHLNITSISTSSIHVEDADGNTFIVRIDDASGLTASILGISAGQTITVIGPLSYYDFNFDINSESYVFLKSNYQLMLTSSDDIEIE
ncbi:MAG: thermonuclease family protein [Firmicutes bacterium]|nr:thermonuclease family protein [Bacillota bacterium]